MATNTKLTQLISGRKVESARQRETELDIDFEDGSTLTLKLAGATGSVSLTDKNDRTEYAE